MAKNFRSFARWPSGTLPHESPPDASYDDHETAAQAQGVCDLLRKNGLGGDGKVFPLETWVIPLCPERPGFTHQFSSATRKCISCGAELDPA